VREYQVPIFGVLGVIQFLSGWFVIVITERQPVGVLENSEIYHATKFNIYPIPAQDTITEDEVCSTNQNQNQNQSHDFLTQKLIMIFQYEKKKVQTQFLQSLNATLQGAGFYYSPTYDITHTTQRRAHFDVNQYQLPLYERADPRFFWNSFIMKPFIENKVFDWVLPVMDGLVEFVPYNIGEFAFRFILISRRDCSRTGARFHTRGADPEGNVANFAETEQIVICNGNTSSWVQTRGSIPLIWFQGRTLKAKPTVDYSPFSVSFYRKFHKFQKSILLILIF
jgi:phosphatidylinositol 4-phosphatase